MKDKKYCIVKHHYHYTGKYRAAAHSICNLKYSVPKKVSTDFYNGYNYDYHFTIKESAEELKKTVYLFRRIHNLYSSNRKKKLIKIDKIKIDKNWQELIKMEKKLQKIYLKYYKLLIEQGL